MAALTDQKLLSLLRAEGPQSPASLTSRLGLSQPTLFRSAKAQQKSIIALGGPRNRKLAALRSVRALGTSTPVFRISSDGDILPVGNMFALFPSSSVLVAEAAPSKPEFFSGLPFFLDDIRPQGFLGRAFGQKHSELQLPARITDWNNDDILEAISRRGEDLSGNLLVGAESFERYQSLRHETLTPVDANHPEKQYVANAKAAHDGQPAGSSVAGEQPKFGAALIYSDGTIKKVLVKYSPSGATFAAQRWRDLLVCESIALEILRKHHIAAAESRIIVAGERTFLETIRFDRVGDYGRKGVLSLGALENEWTGGSSNWAGSADLLAHEKKITAADLKTIRLLESFGRLIANSDRHPGNLSFFWEPGDTKATLAPIYDMLPMLYAPTTTGEDAGRTFTLPSYDHTLLSVWKDALSIAISYWEKVRQDLRLSDEFKKIAAQNLRILQQEDR